MINTLRSRAYCNINRIWKSIEKPNSKIAVRYSSSKSTNTEEEEDSGPVKYLESDAAMWKAKSSRFYGTEEQLWYQPYVVSFSTAIFLLYFCILREENDIDLELGKSLYDRVPGMEKEQLLRLHQQYLDNGKSVVEIEKRLKELLIEERTKKQ